MNKKAMSELLRRNNPFSIFTVFLLLFGTVKTGVAVIIFITGILPIIQGFETFDIGVLIGFLIFGVVGIGLYSIVIYQTVKFLRYRYLLKRGNDGKGTFVSSDEILINREPFFRIKYTYNDENNQQHEAKTKYIYCEYDVQKLQEMGTFPIKFKGKHSAAAWTDEIPTVDGNDTLECRIALFKRIIFRINIVLGILIFVSILGTILIRGAEFSITNKVDRVLIAIPVLCLLGIIFTNVIAGILRKILFIKSITSNINEPLSKSKYF